MASAEVGSGDLGGGHRGGHGVRRADWTPEVFAIAGTGVAAAATMRGCVVVVLGAVVVAGCGVEVGVEGHSTRVDEPAERGVWWDNTNPELATCVETDGRAGRYTLARKGVGVEVDSPLTVTTFAAGDGCKSYECPDRGYRGMIAPGIGDEAESPIYFYRPVDRDHRVLRVIAHVHPVLTFFTRFPVEPNRTGTCAEVNRAWLAEGATAPGKSETPSPVPDAEEEEPLPDAEASECTDGACGAEDEGLCDGTSWLCEGGCWWWVPEWCGDASGDEGDPASECDPCGTDQEGLCDAEGWSCADGCWTWSPDVCEG